MELLKRKEAALFIGVSVSYLDKLRAKGKGPAFIKLGGDANSLIRYDKKEIEAWLNQYKHQS